MLQNAIREVVQPLVRRLGSMAAGALVTYGANADQVAAIETAVIAAGLVAVDLLLSHWNRKK